MKKPRKKIGTIMEERLLYEAKKAALEKAIPFHRFVEQAVEKYVLEGKSGPAKTKIFGPAGVSKKASPYRLRTDIENIPLPETDAATAPISALPFSVPIEERWKRVQATAGKYHSGRKDISVRHDDFAADSFAERK